MTQSIVKPMEAPLETKCGWKGVLKSTQTERRPCPQYRNSTPLKTEIASKGNSDHTVLSVESSSLSESALPDQAWMGGERNLLDAAVEQRGVMDILSSLTETEQAEIEGFDRTMPIRHFRAEKGDVGKALAQIRATLKWRKEFGVDVIVQCFAVADTEQDTKEHQMMRCILEGENATGKIYARGYDHEGRALFYMTPARENTNNELNNMRHLVWNLEKAIACTARQSVLVRPGCAPLEKINLLIDYEGFKLHNAPPMSTTRYTLEILQKHYPERMKHAYLLHPPLVFRAFWALIKSFVDPVTKEKIVFCSGPDGKSKLTDNVTRKDKLEVRSYGNDPTIRAFDSKEYLHLPFNISFDE